MTTDTAVRQVLYQRPQLYPKQEDALFAGERYAVVEASTKAGKTVGCLCWIHEQAALRIGVPEGVRSPNYWWIAPIRRMSKIAYRRLKNYLPRGSFGWHETDMSIFLANGSVITFLGAEDPDTLYGEDVYGAVIDEATRVKADSWYAIRSTLTATQGPIRIIGNVKGRKNWAYKMARRAQAGAAGMAYSKLTVWDAVEAGIFPREEAEDAEANLPEAVYRELYLAEPADDSEQFIQIDKIPIVEAMPAHARTCRVWDFAVTEKKEGNDPDFTAAAKLGYDGRITYGVDVIRRRAAPHVITQLVRDTAEADGPTCDQVMEEEQGAAGKLMLELFRQMLAGVKDAGRVHPSPVTGGKIVRAFHMASAANDGRLWLVKGAWNAAFLEEADDFPDGDHDDQVDAFAHGYNFLNPDKKLRVRDL